MVESPPPAVQRILKSFGFAANGIVELIRTQPNARVHLGAGALVIGLGAWLGVAAGELALLVLTIGLVLVCEAVNTAIEASVDLTSPSFHPLARTAKDVAAGAVLLSALTAVCVGMLVLGPRLLALVR